MLGICLGMQLLFDASVELGGADGLTSCPAVSGPACGRPEGAAHQVEPRAVRALVAADGRPPGRGAPSTTSTRSPRCPPARRDVLDRSEYGAPFVSVVARGSLFGVQFHPEKSSSHGLRLLENFAAICARVAA